MSQPLNHSTTQPLNPPLLAWTAPEFLIYLKGRTWYLVAGLIVLSIVIWAILSRAVDTAIVFLIFAGVYMLYENKMPRLVEIKITGLGIYIGEKLLPFNNIKTFWIVYKPPYITTLNLRLTGTMKRDVAIQLGNADPVLVREILSREVPEWEGKEEGVSDVLTRILRL